MKKDNYYLCDTCNAIIKSDSSRAKIKSHCNETGKSAVLEKIKNIDELAKILRQRCQSQETLNSFKPKDRIFLEMAFEQGAKIVFNRMVRK